jgi:hypothetical protein
MALVTPFLKRRSAVHIFITSDHSEIMGEDGHWGHGFTDLRVAMVPMMLLTNRPQSNVAASFKSWSPPTAYHLAQTVALALGVQLDTSGVPRDRFFINNTMPFALAGFTAVEQLKPGVYRVKNFARNGQLLSQNVGAMAFKLSDILVQKGYAAELAFRPSETIELYLYYFILTYLIVFARRIREIEASDGGA